MDTCIENSRRYTRRRDPTSGLVHVGAVWQHPTRDERVWVPICKLSPRTNTVFWSICDRPEHTTCLRCLVTDEGLI